MNHKLVRITLCALEVHAAVCTVAGGVALLAGVIRFPLAMLKAPFSATTQSLLCCWRL